MNKALLLLILIGIIVSTSTAISTASSSSDEELDDYQHRYSLSDPPIQGDAILYLDNNPAVSPHSSHLNEWKLAFTQSGNDEAASSTSSLPVLVPGDLISDLLRNNQIPEPYYENNFQNTSFCDGKAWEFSLQFDYLDQASKDQQVLLVLDGIKMGAQIYLNEQLVGTTTDQFLRYQFQVDPVLKEEANMLRIRFDPEISTDGRFMACTGGWDWAPFSTCPKTKDTNSRVFSQGITKSVYLVAVSSTVITAVVPQTFYKGEYPTSALEDGTHAGFEVKVRVHLWSSAHTKGHLIVQGCWGGKDEQMIEWNGGDAAFTISIMADAKDIKLWWPTGMGPQASIELSKRPLYRVKAQFIPVQTNADLLSLSLAPLSSTIVQDSRRIGFRHFALVTGNDTDPLYVQNATGKEGTDFAGIYFRVNGVALWTRGANMIPMDELEGRFETQAHVQVVKSAVLGNMNTLRVWGGGIFLPSAWYDACDEYGVLVIQDQMYAQGGHYPKQTQTQELEIRHNVRVLSNHPSIVIWDGCNECSVQMDKPSSIYATFVMRVVAEEDSSRTVWPSCPANGWKSGTEKLTSRPIPGKDLVTPKQVPRTIEVHGPYLHGGGFPAVNGDNDMRPVVDPKLPIKIDPKPEVMGMGQPSVFASEFGAGGVMSSFESMSPTLDSKHWNLHGGAPLDNCTQGFNKECSGGNVMAQRNYPCDNIIVAYFPTEPDYFNQVGTLAFQRQLYHCMIGQALQMKSTIEERKSKNELGHLVWQLNEIWPTGGWGSLEYGNSKFPGQVLGGRWKPLHYFYRQSIFSDVMATCDGNGTGYIRNDGAGMPFDGSIVIEVVNLVTGLDRQKRMVHDAIRLPPGPGSMQTFVCPIVDGATHFLSIDVLRGGTTRISRNCPILLKPPKELTKNISCDSGLEWTVGKMSDTSATIHINAAVPVAVLVVLTTQAQGRFSDNAFSIIGGSTVVEFYSFGGDLDFRLLKETLRAEDMAMYQYGHCVTKQETEIE